MSTLVLSSAASTQRPEGVLTKQISHFIPLLQTLHCLPVSSKITCRFLPIEYKPFKICSLHWSPGSLTSPDSQPSMLCSGHVGPSAPCSREPLPVSEPCLLPFPPSLPSSHLISSGSLLLILQTHCAASNKRGLSSPHLFFVALVSNAFHQPFETITCWTSVFLG